METAELSDEASILTVQERVSKERPNQTAKKITFALEEVTKELRKKEARKPLYLTRYE
jgi:hypothetical protein